MAYKKATIRRMPETSRKLAKLINELDCTRRKLKNLMTDIQLIERQSIALTRRNTFYSNQS